MEKEKPFFPGKTVYMFLIGSMLLLTPSFDIVGQVPMNSQQVLGCSTCLVIDDNGHWMNTRDVADIVKLAAKNKIKVYFYIHTIKNGELIAATMAIGHKKTKKQNHTIAPHAAYRDSLLQPTTKSAFKQSLKKNTHFTAAVWEAKAGNILVYYMARQTTKQQPTN